MPLFRSSSPEHQAAPPPQEQNVSRSRSIFSRRSHSPDYAPSTTDSTRANSTRSGGGLFGRRRSSSSDEDYNGIRRDPSILNARQKVTDAEAAEREADRALMQARAAVRSAREHVRILERESLEETRRAKAKQSEAKNVSKSARALGRHG